MINISLQTKNLCKARKNQRENIQCPHRCKMNQQFCGKHINIGPSNIYTKLQTATATATAPDNTATYEPDTTNLDKLDKLDKLKLQDSLNINVVHTLLEISDISDNDRLVNRNKIDAFRELEKSQK